MGIALEDKIQQVSRTVLQPKRRLVAAQRAMTMPLIVSVCPGHEHGKEKQSCSGNKHKEG